MIRKIIRAPWSREQIDYLKEWQNNGMNHPYTCGGKKSNGKDCRANLIPTVGGWKCPKCWYVQDWFIIYE